MSIAGDTLPARYVYAYTLDPGIDWIASAAPLGVKVEDFKAIECEAERNGKIEDAAQEAYARLRAVAALPLVAKAGQQITRFFCRPLTHDEFADVAGQMGNAVKVATMCAALAIVDVENLGKKFERLSDVGRMPLLQIGSRIWAANQMTPELADFS